MAKSFSELKEKMSAENKAKAEKRADKLPMKFFNDLRRSEWHLMMLIWGEGGNTVWFQQEAMGEKIGCSVRTVGRCLRSLIEKKYLQFTGRRHEGRYKVYAACPMKAAKAKKMLKG